MIRIVDTKNKQLFDLSKDQKAVFKLLGIVVADHPNKLKKLLFNYGIKIPHNAT